MANAPRPSGADWSRAAKAYDSIVDETDALNPIGAACKQILQIVDDALPFDLPSYALDMGTGSGPLISSVLNSAEHAAQIPDCARVVAADVAQGLLDILSVRKAERAQTATVWERLEVMDWDARGLNDTVQDGDVSHLISSYAYFAFADEAEALAEAHRIVKPDGMFIGTSMGYTEWGNMPSFFQSVRPNKVIPGPGQHWQSIDGVKMTLEAVGFTDVRVREFERGIPFETHEAAIEMVFQAFPWVKEFIADVSEREVAESREKMREFVIGKHPEAPLVLSGIGLVGWGRK